LRRDTRTLVLSEDLRRASEQVHKRLAELFSWVSDEEKTGLPEDWRDFINDYRAGRYIEGDCDDFMLTAASALRDAGVSASDMAFHVCRTEEGELHSVLVVGGRWVVDNRHRHIVEFENTGYTWMKHMNCDNPGYWFETEINHG